MLVGPSATPVEWRGVSVKVARRPPTLGNARSSRRHRHLGRAAGDERGIDHTNRSSDPIADAAREHEPGGPLNTDDGTKIELKIRLSPREREVLLAGGTLKFL